MYKKSQFWYISEDLGMENFGTYILLPFGTLIAIWNILWPIG
jgi:hypothetical protein